MRATSDYVENGKGTGYTIMVQQLDPERHPPLDRVGYTDGSKLYVVFTSGQVVGADHDYHRLTVQLGERWLQDHFDRLGEELNRRQPRTAMDRFEEGR